MGFVVSFIDYTPTRRFDDVPWTQIRIEESSSRTGDFTAIDTQVIDPVDADPSNPAARNFTTDEASLESGWYQVVFLDGQQNEQPTEPIYHQVSRDNFVPSVADVGALLRARTKDDNMQELGTFTENTRPTGLEVEKKIAMAAYRVSSRIGVDIPEESWGMAKDVIALRAAMMVELSYFPEQVRSDKSPYKQYQEEFKESLTDLKDAVAQAASGGLAGPGDDPGFPEFDFPADDGGMIGYQTKW